MNPLVLSKELVRASFSIRSVPCTSAGSTVADLSSFVIDSLA